MLYIPSIYTESICCIFTPNRYHYISKTNLYRDNNISIKKNIIDRYYDQHSKYLIFGHCYYDQPKGQFKSFLLSFKHSSINGGFTVEFNKTC